MLEHGNIFCEMSKLKGSFKLANINKLQKTVFTFGGLLQ